MKVEPEVPHSRIGFGSCKGPFQRLPSGYYRCDKCGGQVSAYEYYQMRRDANERTALRASAAAEVASLQQIREAFNEGIKGRYVIRSAEGYWSNKIGWVTRPDATIFDSTNYNLPIGKNVRWEEVIKDEIRRKIRRRRRSRR